MTSAGENKWQNMGWAAEQGSGITVLHKRRCDVKKNGSLCSGIYQGQWKDLVWNRNGNIVGWQMRMVAFRSSVCINDSDALRITTVTNYAHKNNILNYFSVANFTKKITLLFMHRASSNLLFSSTVDKYTHILLCLHSTSSCRCQCFLPLSA